MWRTCEEKAKKKKEEEKKKKKERNMPHTHPSQTHYCKLCFSMWSPANEPAGINGNGCKAEEEEEVRLAAGVSPSPRSSSLPTLRDARAASDGAAADERVTRGEYAGAAAVLCLVAPLTPSLCLLFAGSLREEE